MWKLIRKKLNAIRTYLVTYKGGNNSRANIGGVIYSAKGNTYIAKPSSFDCALGREIAYNNLVALGSKATLVQTRIVPAKSTGPWHHRNTRLISHVVAKHNSILFGHEDKYGFYCAVATPGKPASTRDTPDWVLSSPDLIPWVGPLHLSPLTEVGPNGPPKEGKCEKALQSIDAAAISIPLIAAAPFSRNAPG
ncbi:hypothetical protein BU23DRAFT_568150 [Bimuria novae-zelandiae CBS 107.79]|uniref:Uncharacterized protein n=1 Tax=Bimuria novae-zelandiae CBS 107.79 TaxID=1447943 RepID=A0A6A5V8B4_9PLEO|nr:hypothetical protein BU23DRAFT_568150 [Bimuria novae-zelandiae CBS 107.79]